VLALGPLAFRHAIAEVHATGGSVTVAARSSVSETTLVPGGETRLHDAQALPALPTKDLAPPAAPVELVATREHLVRFVWPTHGIITQTFYQYHPGIDIANDVGTPEVAADVGQVVVAGWGSYGIYVEIDHGNGLATRYAHLSAIEVRVGDKVRIGQTVGLLGSTGRSTGPHLHYETRVDGEAVDPQKFLRAGLRLGGTL